MTRVVLREYQPVSSPLYACHVGRNIEETKALFDDFYHYVK